MDMVINVLGNSYNHRYHRIYDDIDKSTVWILPTLIYSTIESCLSRWI